MEHHFSIMRTLLLVIAVFVPPCLTFPPNVGHCPSNFDFPFPDILIFCHWDFHCPVGYKCCVSNDKAVCVPSIPVEKKCPLNDGPGLCVENCFSDSDCSNGQLCCSNGCGHDCTPPIIVKPGQCPDPGFTHQCGTRCFQDGQCSGEKKCCPTSCGQACRHPI